MPKNKSDKLVNEQHHLDNTSQMQGNMSLLKISKASIFFTEQVKIPVMYASYICGSTKTLSSYAVTNMSSLTHTPTHTFNNTNFICGFTQEGCSTVLQALWRPQSAFSMAQKGGGRWGRGRHGRLILMVHHHTYHTSWLMNWVTDVYNLMHTFAENDAHWAKRRGDTNLVSWSCIYLYRAKTFLPLTVNVVENFGVINFQAMALQVWCVYSNI